MDLIIIESKPIKTYYTEEPVPLRFYSRPETTDIKVIDEVINRNVYQKAKLDFYIEPESFWLDLGANIGTFSVLVLAKGGKVLAYEPEPQNYDLTQGNVQLNASYINPKMADMFTIVKAGVGVHPGVANLYLCKGDYNKYRHTVFAKRGRQSIKIQIESFAEILQQNPTITGIKMDIEGSEIEILENLPELNPNITHMVFEYSFDVDPSIPRFLKIIEKLREIFTTVHYTKVKDTELEYKYFPPCTNVFCIRRRASLPLNP